VSAVRKVRTPGVRAVRRRYHALERRANLDADAGGPRARRPSGRRIAKMSRVLSLLVDYVFADGRTASELRWPDGVDPERALRDVIRVLSAVPPDAPWRRPDIAADEPAADAAALGLSPEVR
jgi:hypothetical protein